MSDLMDSHPAAWDWVDDAIRRHSKGIFGELVPAMIWSSASRDGEGELLVPADPVKLVARINEDIWPLYDGHDPGKPIGQVIESANFENESGIKFVVAVLGYYAGGEVLTFQGLDLDIEAFIPPPSSLPNLPDDIWIEFAKDPREVDAAWVDLVTSDAPLRVKHTELSHNAANSTHDLIRVYFPYVALVWIPFITAITSEVGKATYAGIHRWIQKLLTRLSDRREPILVIQADQDDCGVSFIFRGKNVKQHYAAHDALPSGAVRAKRLVIKLKARGMVARQLVYEFDKEGLKWFPSYAILNDGQIIVDNIKLIAIEQLPKGLSLGLTGKF